MQLENHFSNIPLCALDSLNHLEPLSRLLLLPFPRGTLQLLLPGTLQPLLPGTFQPINKLPVPTAFHLGDLT